MGENASEELFNSEGKIEDMAAVGVMVAVVGILL